MSAFSTIDTVVNYHGTMRGSFTMNKGSESDADPPERAIEGSHPLEDATSFRRVELRLLRTNGTQEQVR